MNPASYDKNNAPHIQIACAWGTFTYLQSLTEVGLKYITISTVTYELYLLVHSLNFTAV